MIDRGKKAYYLQGEKKKENEQERKSNKSKNAREQRTERERGRETSRETENKNQKERGGWRGWNVLTRRFLSELPKLIISSGLAKPCQEQEPTAKPQPGQALPATTITPIPHASTPPTPPPNTHTLNTQPAARLWGLIGGAACLSACSGQAKSGTLPQGFCLFRSFD